jgi:alpha/beta superfamily hydrolase
MRYTLYLTILFIGAIFMVDSSNLSADEQVDSEQAVCGALREPLAFWLWQRMAGRPDKSRIAHTPNVQSIRFTARDGVILSGYKIAARVPRGYVLVAQGNAMLADQLVADLQLFREQGFDVYLYDYRGYGLSGGKSRLAAIIADYSDIVAHLNTLGYTRNFVYGISIGGVMLLNAVGRSHSFDAAVIDSSPSYISNFGCPESYDPMRHLPEDSSHIMIISGVRDHIVSPAQMAELIRIGASRGAYVFRDIEFSHPFQDKSPEVHRRRLDEVARFFMRESVN